MANKSEIRRALEICDRALYPYVRVPEKVDAARRALRLCEDCATAYTLLAWYEAADDDEALRLHEQAVAAGECALERIRLKRGARRRRLFRRPGEFPEAVAYARSRLALAKALRDDGRLEEAIEHARAVFDANEDESEDPLGASHLLIPWLAARGLDEEGLPMTARDTSESTEISDNLEWAGREDFQVFGPWAGKTDYEISYWRAQEIIWDLDENPLGEDPDLRRAYALSALTAFRDCADAYVILGWLHRDYDEDLQSARECYESGVKAGERALKKLRGIDVFDRERGIFYGTLESRPYVRARGSLAVTLYELGEKKAAEDNARALLSLNEHDTLGLRYELAQWLFEQGRLEELHAHLEKHNAFSEDPWTHDVGFENDLPHVLPTEYWYRGS